MTYEGIEYVIRAGLGRNEWAITNHFPNASDALARSSVVKVTGTRDEAIALTRERIHNWLKRQKVRRALYLILPTALSHCGMTDAAKAAAPLGPQLQGACGPRLRFSFANEMRPADQGVGPLMPLKEIPARLCPE